MVIFCDIPKNLILEGPRIILRPISLENSKDVCALFNNQEAMKNLIWMAKPPKIWSIEEIEEGLKAQIELRDKGQKLPFDAFLKPGISNNNEEIYIGSAGIASLNLSNHEGKFGVIVNPKYQNGGYATEMIYLVLKYAFETIKLHRVAAETSVDNKSMRGWLERISKTDLEATIKDLFYWDGKYYSLAIYPIFEEDWFKKTKPSILEKLSKYIEDISQFD